MTRKGGVCGHCASPLSLPRLRTDVSVAAVTLGLVGLTGCELFDRTVGRALGWSTEQTDTGVGDIYGSPSMMDDPKEPDDPESKPAEELQEPADIYGSPSMMEEPDELPEQRDQPLYGVP